MTRRHRSSSRGGLLFLLVAAAIVLLRPDNQHGRGRIVVVVKASPLSKPYIAFRTSPYDQQQAQSEHGGGGSSPSFLHHALDLDQEDVAEKLDPQRRSAPSKIHPYRQSQQQTSAGLALSRDTRTQTSSNPNCPLRLSIGISKRLHGGGPDDGLSGNKGGEAIRQPPILFPQHKGPGRNVVVNSVYEHLDLYSPAFLSSSSTTATTAASQRQRNYVKEILVQASEYPLLMESSSFLTHPLLFHTPGDDSQPAVILSDYDGGVYVVGLGTTTATGGGGGGSGSAPRKNPHNKRYFHRTQVPRLYVRREWMERRVHQELVSLGLADPDDDKKKREEEAADAEKDGGKEKKKKDAETPNDPYHSYFEYYFNSEGESQDSKEVLRGVSANVLGQDHAQLQELKKRRARRQAALLLQKMQQQKEEHHARKVEEQHQHQGKEGFEVHSGESGSEDDPHLDDLEKEQVRFVVVCF